MTFRSLSLLVPTRGQVPRLSRMWDSYCRTVENAPVEAVFRVDEDDADTIMWMRATAVEGPAPRRRLRWFTRPAQAFHRTVVVGPQLEGYKSLPRFFNHMAQYATGDLLMCGNDDMTFMTKGWAARFLKEANRYPDGLFDLGCWSYPAGVFPFSVVSRKAIEKLGFINDERLLYSDIFLRDVMGHFGRALLIPEIEILHVGQMDKDATYQKWLMSTKAVEYWAEHERCVEEAVAVLRRAA